MYEGHMKDTAYAGGALIGASVTYGADKQMPPNALADAGRAMDEARSLAFRVDDLVNRLCGQQPQEVSGKNPSAVPGSIFAGIRDEAERTSDAVRRAMNQISRLEREIPG